MLFLKDRISASMTKRISGIKEIILKRRISLNSLKTTTEVPAPVGIKEEITIIESKIFQPSLKKFNFFSSPKKRIRISITKNIVIA